MHEPTGVLAAQAARYQALGPHGAYPEMVDRKLLGVYRTLVFLADFLFVLPKLHSSPEDVKILTGMLDKLKLCLKTIYAIIFTPDVARNICTNDKLFDELTKDAKRARKEVAPSQAHAASFIMGGQSLGFNHTTTVPLPFPFSPAPVAFTAPPASLPSFFFSSPPAPPGPSRATGSFPPNSCIFHPASTTHSTAGCKQGRNALAKPAAVNTNTSPGTSGGGAPAAHSAPRPG